MIFISILILIVAFALPSINKQISPILFTRISSIVFIYAGALSLNALYIQSIGSGISIYSRLFQVTTVSQLIDTFIFIIGSLILILGLLGLILKTLVLMLKPNSIRSIILKSTQLLNKISPFSIISSYTSKMSIYLFSGASAQLGQVSQEYRGLIRGLRLFKSIKSKGHKETRYQISKHHLSNLSNSSLVPFQNPSSFKLIFLNIFSYFLYACLLFLLFFFNGNVFYSSIIIFMLSIIISYLVLNKFQFSEYLIIRYLQKTILFVISYVIFMVVLSYFDLGSVIHCAGTDNNTINSDNNNTINSDSNNNNNDNYKIDVSLSANMPKTPVDEAIKVLGNLAGKVAGDIGSSAAAGSATAAMIKVTQGMPAGQRLLIVEGTAAATKAGISLGGKGAEAISNNLNIESLIKKSEHANPDITRIPSPGPEFNINSSLEPGDQSIPLLDLLDVINSFNILELTIICLMLYILLIKYINNFNFVFRLIINYMPTKYHNWAKVFDSGKNLNSKFLNIMLVILIVLLLIFKLMNLYFSTELYTNIDLYVSVYNFLTKK